MRLFFSCLLAACLILLAAGLVSDIRRHLPPFWFWSVMATLAIAVCFLVAALWNPPPRLASAKQEDERFIDELRQMGQLEEASYTAVRAFRVEDFEDLGPHYFLELADHSVLHLQGDYLYDFEPITGDSELNAPRRFPCREFVLRKDRRNGQVVQIVCQGDAFEPEATLPPFDENDWKKLRVPEDGEIITSVSYDELKRNPRLAKSDEQDAKA